MFQIGSISAAKTSVKPSIAVLKALECKACIYERETNTMLGCGVVTKSWDGGQTSLRGVGKQQTSTRLVFFAEESDSFSADVRRAPEVGVEHLASLILGSGFEVTDNGPTGVVEDNVNTAESFLSLNEGVLYLGDIVYIKLEDKKLSCGIIDLEVVEVTGSPGSGDHDLALIQQELSHETADSSRGSSDCEI